MINAAHPEASWFLIVSGIGLLLAFGIPLLFFPLRWARVFRWPLPEESRLTVYLGRCVGALAIAFVFGFFRAAPQPTQHLLLYELMIVGAVGLTGLHVWGAITRAQPWTENLEIGLYAALLVASVWLRVSLA